MIHTRAARAAPGLAFAATLLVSVLGFGVYYDRTCAAATAQALAALDRDLAREGWSAPVRRMAAWAIRTDDHRGLPFVIIDQTRERLFAFDAQGRLAGSAPILDEPVGAASAPAGRFVADTQRSSRRGAIVWANDRDMVTLDAAPAGQEKPQPLAAALHRRARNALHVPGEFWRKHLHAWSGQASIAYVLPRAEGVRRSFRGYAAHRAPPLPPPRRYS